MAARKPTTTKTTARATVKATTARTKATTTKAAATKRKEKEEDPLQVPLFDSAGERHGEVRLPKLIFAEEPNAPVMHQAYVRQMANARQGTASTKNRGQVSGGGAKPYRQKGTGRARHGSIREPSMKGGGVVFGPRPRDYSQRMPKQMRRLALRSALSQKAIEGRVRVIDGFGFEEPRTKLAADLIAAIGFDDRVGGDGSGVDQVGRSPRPKAVLVHPIGDEPLGRDVAVESQAAAVLDQIVLGAGLPLEPKVENRSATLDGRKHHRAVLGGAHRLGPAEVQRGPGPEVARVLG